MKVKLVGKSRQTADLSIARLLKENTFPSSGSARRNWLDPIARSNTDRDAIKRSQVGTAHARMMARQSGGC